MTFKFNPFTKRLDFVGTGSGPPVTGIATLSSEGGPATDPDGSANFNFSGSTAGGSAANGAIEFITPGGPGAATNGQMDAKVLVDGLTVIINASNQLQAINGGLIWTVITGNTAGVKGHGYFANPPGGPGGLTVTLPSTAAVGDTLKVYAMDSGGFVIAQNAGQKIQIGNAQTTPGVTGNVIATAVGDAVTLVCSIANTQFEAVEFNGNLIIN